MSTTLVKLEQSGYKLYRISDQLTFALSEDKTIMVTPLLNYIITKHQRNSQTGYERIRQCIKKKQYKSVSDVLTDMELETGIGVAYRCASAYDLYGEV